MGSPLRRPDLTNERAAQTGSIELIVHTHCARRDWYRHEDCCNREIQIAGENAAKCIGVSRQNVDPRNHEHYALRVRYAELGVRFREMEQSLKRLKERIRNG